MSIHNQETTEVGYGFEKEIEVSAIPMILDNLQRFQYQYPIKSTVREIASNAYDSVQEKLAAARILRGEAKVEDYFIHRDDPLYKDSNWDPAYYDLARLNMAANEVLIRYVEGKDYDRVEITDYGIGLGGKRLRGYFKLGWSSKRNTKLALGKFGIGAKVPLSTGVPFYTMESRYNGQLYRFNVYDHKVDPIIPSLNLVTGKPNPHITWVIGEGDERKEMPVFYEEQEGTNYTTISLQVKKHHKQQYLQAVHQQLLYFSAIRFEIVDSEGGITVSNPQAEVLYEDEYLIVSENQQYAKPHLLINNVCYGYIDWQELELEDRMGNVALKVRMEDVTVNPSRESVIWNDTTRATVLQRIENAIEGATRLVEQELRTDDLFTWIKTVAQISYKRDGSVVGRLAQFSGASTFRPRFMMSSGVMIDQYACSLIANTVFNCERGELVKTSKKIKYDKHDKIWLEEIFSLPTYRTEETNRTLRKRKYLCQTHNSRVQFINLNEKNLDLEKFLEKLNDTEVFAVMKNGRRHRYELDMEDLLEVIELLRMGFIEHAEDYDVIEVPEGFTLTEAEEEDHGEESDTPLKVTPTRAAKQISAKVPYVHGGTSVLQIAEDRIRSISLPEVFVGTMNDQDNARAQLIGAICYGRPEGRKVDPVTRKPVPAGESLGWNSALRANQYADDDHLKHVKDLCEEVFPEQKTSSYYRAQYYASQREAAHGKDTGAFCLQLSQEWYRKTIDKYYTYEEFFMRVENDGSRIAMSGILQKWYTAQLIEHAVKKYRFLYHMNGVYPELAEKYRKIYHHWHKYGVNVVKNGKVDETSFSEMMEFCNKVATLQRECENPQKSDGDIRQLSQQLFSGEFAEAKAYDSDLVAIAEELEDLEPVKELCDQLYFTGPGKPLSDLHSHTPEPLTHAQEVALKEYFQFKHVNPQ